jgi:hypothetical protein
MVGIICIHHHVINNMDVVLWVLPQTPCKELECYVEVVGLHT